MEGVMWGGREEMWEGGIGEGSSGGRVDLREGGNVGG
jgi:hypothetical protein